jgi:formylglycine-generating enzyme required for sulfatase activity
VQRVGAFGIEVYNVTNDEFMEFVDAGGYRDAKWWRPADWAWISGEGSRIRDSGRSTARRDRGVGTGAACSSASHCRRRGGIRDLG